MVASNNQGLSLRPAGENVFWSKEIRLTQNYEVVEPPVRKKLETPIMGEVAFPGQDGLFIYGEAHYESQYFYYVKPYFVEPENYFAALRFMKQNVYSVNRSGESERKDAAEQALFNVYQQASDAPYGYFSVEKNYFNERTGAHFLAVHRQGTGYTALEEVVRLHLKANRIPSYVLDNLIVRFGMDEKDLVRLAYMLTDDSKHVKWKESLAKATNKSCEMALSHYPVETYRVLESYLKKETVN